MDKPTVKTCSKCAETKPVTEYWKNRGTCKTCCNAAGRAWINANPDKLRAKRQRYIATRVRGPQKYSAEYYARNAEHIRAKNARYIEQRMVRNPEQVAADRQRLRPDGMKICGKCRLKQPLSEFYTNLRTADGLHGRCRTCQCASGGNGNRLAKRALKWWAANGMSPTACTYCGAELNYLDSNPDALPIHVDHIVPASRGGSDEPENLAPSCPPCNQSKAAKPLAVWLTE